MTQGCVVVVAPPDLLPELKRFAADPALELLAFEDGAVLAALESIITRRPRIVALERQFACAPRGAALVERITSDPALAGCEVRLVARDGAYTTAAARPPLTLLPDRDGAEPVAPAAGSPVAVAAPPGAPVHDRRGTRRATRHRMAGDVAVLVDGNAALLVDLSTLGAQIVSPSVLKPNQRVRMTLPDDAGSVRINAQIAWASFEIPPNAGPRYRAGLEFLDADPAAVNAFRLRHQ